jgi:hypothetical protein
VSASSLLSDRRQVRIFFTYAAEPGSRSEEARMLLGSWAAEVYVLTGDDDLRPVT